MMTKQEEKDYKRPIIEALHSVEGQGALKNATLRALGSKEGKEILTESFVENYKELIEPTLKDMWDDLREVKTAVRHMRERYDIKFERLGRKVGVIADV